MTITVKGPMTPDDIQYILRRKGITQKELADRFGVNEMSVSRAISGKMTSEPLTKKIAKVLGISHRDAFPGYYRKDRPRRGRKPLAVNQ
ncbi:hypothetical protein DSCW_21100 [Desulfosarcina widdelii]|uniref:HTH cro/C1-type domain-containing protein n=1 Tax=Desulfosarcina widdelii TaxID=947919 RepID=A0A5K7Z413_9BACT|nr:helix-turn-helix transcriptional regulator [Desulfosarcina widdelii]BBO74693.1 hypothetical protein DSCW_21100 [Desulfosarcina widdelii]